MPEFLKDKKKFLVLLVLILGGCAFAYSVQNGQNGKQFEAYTLQSTFLGQTVEATGSLEPSTSINLSFQKSGEVANVEAEIGKRVKKGFVLASLMNKNEKSVLAQYKALVSEAQAALNLKLAQATDQDIAIARTDLAQAISNKEKYEVDYQNALTDLNNTKKVVEQDIASADLDLQSAKLNLQKIQSTSTTTSSQNSSAVENISRSLKSSIDQLLLSSKNLLQVLDKMYGVKDIGYQSFRNSLFDGGTYDYSYAKDLYIKLLNKYDEIKMVVDSFSSTPTVEKLQAIDLQMNDFIRDMNEDVVDSSLLLDKTAQSYVQLPQLKSELNTTSTAFNTNSSTYKTTKQSFDSALIGQEGNTETTPLDIESAQLIVEQKTQNLTKVRVNSETAVSNKETLKKSAEAQVNVAKAGVEKAQAALDKILASPRAVDIAPYKARVQQAQAQVAKAQSDYDNTLIRAPFDGIITAKNIEIGEQYLITSGVSNTPALAIIDDKQFHIDVNIPETQITKISVNSKASVTFDALGQDETFEGKILSIEPASTVIQDITYYKAKVILVKNDSRLKAGMTANVTITSDSPMEVISIPERAIVLDENNKKTVIVSPDTSKEIRTGMRGKDGMIEVISGLKTGESILVPKN